MFVKVTIRFSPSLLAVVRRRLIELSDPLQTLEKKVFELLTAHGEGKPVLIFCPTRKIVESCAEQLYKDIEQAGERKDRLPFRTTKALIGSFADRKLQSEASCYSVAQRRR
jgi:late competence protein required for DNA uptake (superfamily II DNA/RNA helicase)